MVVKGEGDNVISVLNNLRECNQIETDKVMIQTAEVIYDSDRITTITKLQDRMKVTIVSEFGVWSSSSNSANGRNTRWEPAVCPQQSQQGFSTLGSRYQISAGQKVWAGWAILSYSVPFPPPILPDRDTCTHTCSLAAVSTFTQQINTWFLCTVYSFSLQSFYICKTTKQILKDPMLCVHQSYCYEVY